MSDKTIVLLFATTGSIIGSYLPAVFGASWLSPWSIVLAMIGGFAGIWMGYRFLNP